MALWGKNDAQSNAVLYTVDAAHGKAGNTQYGNTSVGYVGVFGVSNNEVQASEGKLPGRGWVGILDRGNGRKNYELLAATRIVGDGSDDVTVPDYKLRITTQAANVSTGSANSASFTVVAASTPAGASISYEWQANTGSGFAALSANASITGVDTNTLTINPASDLGSGQVRVVISATGAANVTSAVRTLTVA